MWLPYLPHATYSHIILNLLRVIPMQRCRFPDAAAVCVIVLCTTRNRRRDLALTLGIIYNYTHEGRLKLVQPPTEGK